MKFPASQFSATGCHFGEFVLAEWGTDPGKPGFEPNCRNPGSIVSDVVRKLGFRTKVQHFVGSAAETAVDDQFSTG